MVRYSGFPSLKRRPLRGGMGRTKKDNNRKRPQWQGGRQPKPPLREPGRGGQKSIEQMLEADNVEADSIVEGEVDGDD